MYIAGGPGGNSIGPAIHEFIAQSLGLNWTCEFLRLTDVDEVMKLFRQDDFAAALVTMPHKRTIIPLLDSVDDYVDEIGACNFVVRKASGMLHGSNTDWSGIRNAVVAEKPMKCSEGLAAMVYGAGGASRGAVYALSRGLGCKDIYIVNRDADEVAELMTEVEALYGEEKPRLSHVKSVDTAKTLPCPSYIISTVPDFEEKTPTEIECREILRHFLEQGRSQNNILLDMCYHPPMTRNLTAAVEAEWRVIPGFSVVCHQFPEQWETWTGQRIDNESVFSLCDKLIQERETSRTVAAV